MTEDSVIGTLGGPVGPRRTARWGRAALAAALSTTVLAGPAQVGPGPGHTLAAPIEPEVLIAPLSAGEALRVHVPGAEGGKTVLGQLTVARASQPGYVTAYGCDDGVPRNADGQVGRSDLNYDGRVAHSWSNRLIVKADDDGDVCFYTVTTLEMIVDVNAVSFDTGITSFPNRRIDTRNGAASIEADGVLRVNVPEASGSKTVIGQLTSARATEQGFVTAYGCERGLPRDEDGQIDRSDLNHDGRVTPSRSNRLIVEADDDGDVCFYTTERVDLVVDFNGVADSGITSFPNRRTDTRSDANRIPAAGVLRVNVPEAVGAKTVIGQLTAAQLGEPGYVTAYGCDDGLPRDAAGAVDRSDLNYDQRVSTSRSNRLVVQADEDGDVCFHTLRRVDLVVDINGVSETGITSFPNRRTDTRLGTGPNSHEVPLDADGVPVWPPYDALPPVDGVAALTGLAAEAEVTNRPIVAVKVDNYRRARPHIGLDRADAVLEVNVEGVSRFVALFHSHTPPTIGPVRSARTTDLDLLAAMNRPIFGYSGANPGVTQWIDSASTSDLLVDHNAQHSGCYSRDPERVGPHNLVLHSACVLSDGNAAGPARPLWSIDPDWTIPGGVGSTPDEMFEVPMDGVRVEWTWDPVSELYVRSQDGDPHLVDTGARITASTVVELVSVHRPSTVDARSPHVVTLGSGSARIHRDGRAFTAMWSRDQPYDRFTFLDAATDAPIPLDRGVAFLEFVRDL